MCKCLNHLINCGAIKLVDSKCYIYATKDRRVLLGCEKIEYCPICGEKLYQRMTDDTYG